MASPPRPCSGVALLAYRNLTRFGSRWLHFWRLNHQHAILEVGLDVLVLHVVAQGKAAQETACAALLADDPAIFLLGLLFLMAGFNTEHTLFQLHLHILFLHAR